MRSGCSLSGRRCGWFWCSASTCRGGFLTSVDGSHGGGSKASCWTAGFLDFTRPPLSAAWNISSNVRPPPPPPDVLRPIRAVDDDEGETEHDEVDQPGLELLLLDFGFRCKVDVGDGESDDLDNGLTVVVLV